MALCMQRDPKGAKPTRQQAAQMVRPSGCGVGNKLDMACTALACRMFRSCLSLWTSFPTLRCKLSLQSLVLASPSLALLAVSCQAGKCYFMALSIMCAVSGIESAADNPDCLPASLLQCWSLTGAGVLHVLICGSLAVWQHTAASCNHQPRQLREFRYAPSHIATQQYIYSGT